MAETSAGKIQLDLELGGDIKEQIREAAGKIGEGLEKQLNGKNLDMGDMTKNLDKVLAGMEMAFRNSFDDIRTMADDMARYVRESMAGAVEGMQHRATEVTLPNTATVNPSARATGPPASGGVKVKAPSIGPDTGAIRMQMEQLNTVLSRLDLEADQVRGKIKALNAEIARLTAPTGNKVQDFVNTESLTRARQELQALEAQHEKIGSKATGINDKYIRLENSLAAIKNQAAGVGTATAEVAGKAATIPNPVERSSAAMDQLKAVTEAAVAPARSLSASLRGISAGAIQSTASAVGGLRARISGVGSSFMSMGVGATSWLGRIGSSVMTTARRIFILGAITAGLRSAFSIFAYGAGQTAGFNQALSNLKTAFYTAMYPIYQAVLPALITFMNALAGVINYLAVFISMLTGSTYKASYQGAKGLAYGAAAAEHMAKSTGGASKAVDKAGKTLEDTGSKSKDMADDVKKSAEKAKRALAGFDELNILSFPKDPEDKAPKPPKEPKIKAPKMPEVDPGPTMPDFAGPMMGLPAAIAAITPAIEFLKDLFKTLFDPLKKAWDKQGPVFMAALGDAIQATKDIFMDLYRVLKTPPVQEFMQKMWEIVILLGAVALRIYADFIAPIIRWFVNSLPKAAEAWNPVLDKIIERLEELAAPGFGAEALDKIIPALDRFRDALLPFTVTLGEGLIWIYDNVLYPLTEFVFEDVVPRLLDLISAALTLLNDTLVTLQPLWQWAWDNIFLPIAEWTGEAFLAMLDGLTAALNDISTWITENQGVVETITIILTSLAAAIGIVKIGMILWTAVSWLATYGTTALGLAFLSINWPIIAIIAAITLIIAVTVLLWKNWDAVKAFLVDCWNKLKEDAAAIWTAVKTFFSNTWAAIKTKVTEVWNAIKKFFSECWTALKEDAAAIWNAVKKFFSDTWTAIKTKVTEVWNAIKKFFSECWTALKEDATAIWTAVKNFFSDTWTAIKNKVSEVWNGIKKFFSECWTALKEDAAAIWTNIKTTISDTIDGIRDGISEKFTAAKNKISEIFTNIKSTIDEKINAAKDAVKLAIDAIKGFFGFEFKWPALKMPHFGVEPKGWQIGDLLKGSIPKLGINWYAKGGEFDQPTVIGVGENGREAAVPLENNTGWAKDVAELILGNMGGGGGGGQGDIKLEIDSREIGRAILRDWNRAEKQSGQSTTFKR